MRQVKDADPPRRAPRAGTVLITGETGTGKELVARAIHAGSARARAPVRRAQLRGADRVASRERALRPRARARSPAPPAARAGLIEHATRRHALPRRDRHDVRRRCRRSCCARSKPGEVRRIGENDSRRVDVRFVAATNVDLQGRGRRGRVPERSLLPPQRAPRPPAAAARARGRRRVCSSITSSSGTAPAAGVDGLRRRGVDGAPAAYDYPGNVRQLEHIIQRAVAIARGPQLEPGDLPEELVARPVAVPRAAERHRRGRARARRARDDRRHARAHHGERLPPPRASCK